MASNTDQRKAGRFPIWVSPIILLLVLSSEVFAQSPDNLVALQRQLAAQETIVREQSELLKKQQETLAHLLDQIETLKHRLGELEQTAAAPGAAPSPPVVRAVAARQVGQSKAEHEQKPSTTVAASSSAKSTPSQTNYRDPVGDLNAGSVRAGTFPGSFEIPGTRQVSLAIGGFVKTVAIEDANAESLGADMLPSTLGKQLPDTEGNFSIDSTLTRVFLDARAPAGNGWVRGYIESDLNATNNGKLGINLRQAYGSWKSRAGTLLAGHTWSTLMDLQVIPESLTEPTLSGAIFVRQAQLRWTQELGESAKADFAVEDPTGADIYGYSSLQSRSPIPDFTASLEYNKPGVGHVRFGGIVRHLELSAGGNGPSASATGWGLTMGAYLNTIGKDRLAFSGSYGPGLGRYLLGLGPTSAGIFLPTDERIKVLDNYGGFAWYQHFWTSKWRSTAAYGHAKTQTFAQQPADILKSTTYSYGNLMWSVLPYLTLGLEYDYGRKVANDDSSKDNNRVMFGVQVF